MHTMQKFITASGAHVTVTWEGSAIRVNAWSCSLAGFELAADARAAARRADPDRVESHAKSGDLAKGSDGSAGHWFEAIYVPAEHMQFLAVTR